MQYNFYTLRRLKKSPQEKATQQALVWKHFSRINRYAIALKGSFQIFKLYQDSFQISALLKSMQLILTHC